MLYCLRFQFFTSFTSLSARNQPLFPSAQMAVLRLSTAKLLNVYSTWDALLPARCTFCTKIVRNEHFASTNSGLEVLKKEAFLSKIDKNLAKMIELSVRANLGKT